jgi:hypothetical protein
MLRFSGGIVQNREFIREPAARRVIRAVTGRLFKRPPVFDVILHKARVRDFRL